MKPAVSVLLVGSLLFSPVIFLRAAETNSSVVENLPARSLLTMGGIVTTAERKASPVFTGNKLPAPPEQRAAWTPPAEDLPTNYISATRLLFEQGMSDPRGCDYREIEVGTGDVWRGDGGVVTTHGWVLPGNAGQKFVVCWNGMVYPAVSVGTNADLAADVARLETNGFTSWYSALPEAVSVSQSSSLGFKGCFLLRLGKADWAMRLWLAQERRGRDFQNAWQRQFSQTNGIVSTNEIKLPETDPYLKWATDWAWAMFDRTLCAHEHGDEKLALLTARQLAAAQPQIEAACAQRGFKRQPYWDSNPSHRGQAQPYLNFLGQFPELLADLERRDQEGTHVSTISTGITNVPDQSKRITALIHDLDLVSARQWGQPGWVNPAGDEIVSALIHEGDAAVEPLLQCLEQDKRLTRSVGFGRDFGRGRTVISVSQTAKIALEAILHAGFSNAAEIRAYWDKYKNLKIEDRWYAILNDDSARARWQEAAACIVQPENITTYPGGFSRMKPVPTNAPVPLRGEILRSKTNPSITELLARHALEVPTNNIGSYDLSASCAMAEYLARWDPAAALPLAKILSKRAATVLKYSSQPALGVAVAKLSVIRANNGDPQAFDEYAGWIAATSPGELGYSKSELLDPLLKFYTNPVLEKAAMKMFADTNSPWTNLPWENTYDLNPFNSEFVKTPAFQICLARELAKTNLCGQISWRKRNSPGENDWVDYSITNYSGSFTNTSSGGISYDFPEGSQPAGSVTNELRRCDWLAIRLSRNKIVPFFNPFWPLNRRDEVIKDIRNSFVKSGE